MPVRTRSGRLTLKSNGSTPQTLPKSEKRKYVRRKKISNKITNKKKSEKEDSRNEEVDDVFFEDDKQNINCVESNNLLSPQNSLTNNKINCSRNDPNLFSDDDDKENDETVELLTCEIHRKSKEIKNFSNRDSTIRLFPFGFSSNNSIDGQFRLTVSHKEEVKELAKSKTIKDPCTFDESFPSNHSTCNSISLDDEIIPESQPQTMEIENDVVQHQQNNDLLLGNRVEEMKNYLVDVMELSGIKRNIWETNSTEKTEEKREESESEIEEIENKFMENQILHNMDENDDEDDNDGIEDEEENDGIEDEEENEENIGECVEEHQVRMVNDITNQPNNNGEKKEKVVSYKNEDKFLFGNGTKYSPRMRSTPRKSILKSKLIPNVIEQHQEHHHHPNEEGNRIRESLRNKAVITQVKPMKRRVSFLTSFFKKVDEEPEPERTTVREDFAIDQSKLTKMMEKANLDRDKTFVLSSQIREEIRLAILEEERNRPEQQRRLQLAEFDTLPEAQMSAIIACTKELEPFGIIYRNFATICIFQIPLLFLFVLYKIYQYFSNIFM